MVVRFTGTTGATGSGLEATRMRLHVEIEEEQDGRWLAEVVELPGVMVYADTQHNALRKVQALALQVLADKLDHGELEPEDSFSFEQVQVA